MKNWYSKGALVLLAALFLALTIVTGNLLQGARLDLTEHRLYTLSPGTRNLLGGIDEPVTLDFYFSEDASVDFPQVRSFARRVQELLDEMAQRADGGLVVRRIDPKPFSEEEDAAARYGLEAVPTGRGGDSLYLGIVGSNRLDGLEVLPFLSPARESFLEYELARMIYTLSLPERPRVGLLSGLPMSGGFDMQTRQPREPWAIYTQITEMFEVESIASTATELPDNLDALVLIHPQDLAEGLLVDMDRFVLDGGRLLAFVDPFAESDPGPNPADPMAAMSADRHSSLDQLFAAWGVEFDTGQFVGDLAQALQVSVQAGQAPVRHPGIIGVRPEHMSADDVVTAELDSVNLSSAGALAVTENSGLTLQALLTSSRRSGTLPTERLRFLADPTELVNELGEDDQRHILAARVSGEISSAFAQGDEPQTGTLNAIIVGDVDLLADRYWVQRQQFFGTTLLNPFAGNGSFVINAIENLLGNADLISVRSRTVSSRPFHLVDSLRREAEQSLRATEQRLEAELAETEQRLNELQQSRGDTELSVLTVEQEAEIDRFMEQRLEIRRQLRQVRRDLDRDIERLGGQVKTVNIALMPLLVTVFALGLAWVRRRERRPKQRLQGGGQ